MSDTIHAALDAATKAMRFGYGEPARRMAAETVAAFLNSPPPSAQTIRLYLGEVSPQGLRDIYAYHRWLAAAVTAAAKEQQT